jgi:DNA-binding LacI/PurR family transcriptional regulator
LATNKTTNIGVIIPSANYVYISNMLNGISEVAKEKGFVLTLFTTSHSHEEALSMIEKVITTHVDGAIIFDDELDEEDVMKINSYSVPTIVVNNKITGEESAASSSPMKIS